MHYQTGKFFFLVVLAVVGIHVKTCNVVLQKDPPSFVLSPCQFKIFGKKVSENGSFENLNGQRNRYTEKMLTKTNSASQQDFTNWSNHERITTLFADESDHQDKGTKSSLVILRAWILAEIDVISSFSKTELNSIVLGNNTLLHFQVKSTELTKYAKPHEIRKRAGESLVDIMYVLSVSVDSMQAGVAYELEFSEGNKMSMNKKSLSFFLEKLHLGEGLPLSCVRERISDKRSNMEISSLSWMGTAAADVTNRLMVLLSPSSGMFLSNYNLPFPGHVLIYGPPGSGKTLLATTVAKTIEEHADVLAHIVYVGCSRLASSKSQTIHQALSSYISEALDHTPSLVVLDDLDSIIASPNNSEDHHSSSSSTLLMEFLTDILDEYEV
ncbi:peroxisome biogenesis protein 1 [Tanacetum coccineum]